MYGDMRAGSRDVSDPRGTRPETVAGPQRGVLTSRLRYQPEFPAGTARRPRAAGAV
jgi:hypothetical protein